MNSHKNPLFTPFQKLFFGFSITVILLLISYYIRDLIIPFFSSFLLAYLLTPVVDRMEFIFKKRLIAVILLYVLFFMLSFFLVNFMLPPISEEFNDLSRAFPTYVENIQSMMDTAVHKVETDIPALKQFGIIDQIQAQVQSIVFSFARALPNIFFYSFSVISYLFLIPIIIFFFLLQGSDMKNDLLKIVPNKYFEMTLYLMYTMGSKLGNYLRGLLLETGIVTGFNTLILFTFGVDYALILGAFSGLANIIPYIGPVVGAVPALIIYYFKVKSFQAVFSLILLFAIVQIIDNILLKPIIYSQSVDLHPLTILAALFIGGMMAGIWGLILAVPFAGIMKVVSSQLIKEIRFRIGAWHETDPVPT